VFHECIRWHRPQGSALGLVMEWVPGQALDTWAETQGTTFRQLAHVGATVARTLGELHARGVLHRDLKPEHIRVRAADGQPVLLDFGAGWYEGAVPLTTGPLPPTTLYLLSPEAVRFLWHGPKPPGTRYTFQPTHDLYALGVCLYRATTGHYPFGEWLPADVLQSAIVHVRPQEPRRVNPRVPQALSEVIVRLLAKDPQERYPSGAALHAALVAAARTLEPAWDAEIFERESEWDILRPPRPRLASTSAPLVPVTRRKLQPRRLLLTATVLLALTPALRLARHESVGFAKQPWSTDAQVDPNPAQDEQAPLPQKNQKRAPCTPRLEVEVSSACWHSLKQRPPDCPTQTLAYKGECLWPVPQSPSVPTSVEGGTSTPH
jgi:eukaryotic-like serine/threonine-protein kinase